ncbi:hypothetical protein BHECKSOX2_142 [Bathymodiolus heckerae thiotrophic gill symbiont]|nr:hypothetical protein BHECKSOX2_142 [Bathymodiolus heckerae thiotrophic gill symbiont]
MTAQQEIYSAYRIGGLVLIVLGGITFAIGAMGFSTTFTGFGAAFSIVGIVLTNLATKFKVGIGNKQTEKSKEKYNWL